MIDKRPQTANHSGDIPPELELTDEDILDALAHISGYVDISTEDFRTLYHLAWRHAVKRLQARSNGGAA